MESVQRPINIFQGFFGFFFTAVILIYIMSGIMSLTPYPFIPFVFIQSYYGWVIGFVIYCLILERIGSYPSEKSPSPLEDFLNGSILWKIWYYSFFAPILYVIFPLGFILYGSFFVLKYLLIGIGGLIALIVILGIVLQYGIIG